MDWTNEEICDWLLLLNDQIFKNYTFRIKQENITGKDFHRFAEKEFLMKIGVQSRDADAIAAAAKERMKKFEEADWDNAPAEIEGGSAPLDDIMAAPDVPFVGWGNYDIPTVPFAEYPSSSVVARDGSSASVLSENVAAREDHGISAQAQSTVIKSSAEQQQKEKSKEKEEEEKEKEEEKEEEEEKKKEVQSEKGQEEKEEKSSDNIANAKKVEVSQLSQSSIATIVEEEIMEYAKSADPIPFNTHPPPSMENMSNRFRKSVLHFFCSSNTLFFFF
ncbi:hypothetical protein RFI_00848 [Reticulomyxa filosa]|uniref:SAM domain-containing protein n=1 Tax=Reticulomyxa filosa TaxID=46433 RepID=X6PDD2_RETFI|nr:hypothetical protein RFI_00848 [Reticulomyxa filosa]|eukprot:ETO36216.1 hypothetical protein RFI_00848 [Reticulomyxa filosa]